MDRNGLRFFSFLAFQFWEICIFWIGAFVGLHALAQNQLFFWDGISLGAITLATLAFGVLWSALLHKLNLYESRRLTSRASEVVTVSAAILIACGSLSVFGAVAGIPLNHVLFIEGFVLSVAALMLVTRTAARAFLRRMRDRHGRNLRTVAVVGASNDANKLVDKLTARPGDGFQLVGQFDSNPQSADIGGLDDLRKMLLRQPLDVVFIALPFSERVGEIADLVEFCQRVGVSCRVVNSFVSDPTRNVSVEYIDDVPTLQFSSVADWGWGGHLKRFLDVLIVSQAAIVLMPLFVVTAIAIRLDSPGPILFTQTRIGKNKRPFKLYKFRTMVADAEARQADLEAQNEAGGPVFKMKNDPRVTTVGAFLRRFSIDEFPQFINVLRGEMSIVGPRPLPVRDVDLFEQDWHSRRFSVQPGLTCSWVMAGRSELEFDTWVAMDLDYIDNWSLGKDLNILVNTVPRVLRGSGAY